MLILRITVGIPCFTAQPRRMPHAHSALIPYDPIYILISEHFYLKVKVSFHPPLLPEFCYWSVTCTFVVEITEPTAVFTEKETVIFLFVSELVSRINTDTIAIRAIGSTAVHHVKPKNNNVSRLEMRRCQRESEFLNHFAWIRAEYGFCQITIHISRAIGRL